MLARESATIKGVPVPIIMKFLGDGTALTAYLKGNKHQLHARLQKMDIEEEMKAFYRPKIHNEAKLDEYIHQIFYDNTGYVGEDYYVNSQGILIFKKPVSDGFNEWFNLAYEAGIVIGSKQENGIQYVISPQGTVAPYKGIATFFPLEKLRTLAEMKRQDKSLN